MGIEGNARGSVLDLSFAANYGLETGDWKSCSTTASLWRQKVAAAARGSELRPCSKLDAFERST
jgi:hypothetical protein